MGRIKQKGLSSGQIVMGSFCLMILTGTFLLMLPFATSDGKGASFLDALFTATSASCVTGLIVQNTATYWSWFGQFVIIALIQVGGMGVVTMAFVLFVASGRKIGLKTRFVMQDSIAAPQVGGIIRMIDWILKVTIAIELIAAVLLAVSFYPEYGLLKSIWMGIFHSISAFCNAGFDILGDTTPYISVVDYASHLPINLILTFLIIIGGIGFFVWEDIYRCGLHFRRYKLHTKLALQTTFALLLIGFFFFFFLEFSRDDVWDLSLKDQIIASWFQAVSPRTAGFNTVDLTKLAEPTVLFTVLLMLIGGSPGSTAGGMKTTTLAELILCTKSVLRGEASVRCFGRTIPQRILRNAVSITTLYITLCIGAAMAISVLEQVPILTALYETASAVGTVGLTLGITPQLGTVSRLILIFLMYFGRVGGLTLIYVLAGSQAEDVAIFPKEEITIG